MSSLIRCLDCNRHLRNDEVTCPFCGAEITDEARAPRGSAVPAGASRAARFAARAALIAGAASAVACGGSKKKDETTKKVEGPDDDDRPPPPTPYGCVWPDVEDDDVLV